MQGISRGTKLGKDGVGWRGGIDVVVVGKRVSALAAGNLVIFVNDLERMLGLFSALSTHGERVVIVEARGRTIVSFEGHTGPP